MADLEHALNEAYRTWSQSGRAAVGEFSVNDYSWSRLDARLDELDAVADRCVVSKTKAAWLREQLT